MHPNRYTMTKRKIIRKSNKALNLYSTGGEPEGTEGKKPEAVTKGTSSDSNFGSTIGSISSGITSIVDAGMKNSQIADTSDLEAKITQERSSVVESNNYDDLMNEWGAWSPREHISWRDIRGASGAEMAMNTIGAVGSGASAGASVGGPFGAVVGAAVGLGSSLVGIFTGRNKAKDKADEINQNIDIANARNLRAFSDRAENIDTQNDLNALANFVAYGGLINKRDTGGGLERVRAKRGKARSLTGEPNSFIDDWNSKRLATGRYDDQLGNSEAERQKVNRDSAPVFDNPLTYGQMSYYRSAPLASIRGESEEETARRFEEEAVKSAIATRKRLEDNSIGKMRVGEYNPVSHSIYTNPNYPYNKTHEQAHASKAEKQAKKAGDIVKKKYKDTYWDDGNEVYSRLMELREANGIDPNQIWDKKALKKFKKTALDFDILNRYDDNTVIDLFNNVASNDKIGEGTLAAYGGDLNSLAEGGKIHIKPENRGKFTRLKERTGKSATWFKEHGTPAQRKMATFALNARKWKHDDGGGLYRKDEDLYTDTWEGNKNMRENTKAMGGTLSTHGTDWSNGVTKIDNGGTHEENPYEGIQIGVDNQGVPNLVEEGEVIFDDYVFSNRLIVNKKLLEDFKLPKSYDNHSFAAAAEKLSRESRERPNDPISQRGLIDSMAKLRNAQEVVRQEKQEQDMRKRRYAYGGKKRLYNTGGYDLTFDYSDPLGIINSSSIPSYSGVSFGLPPSAEDVYTRSVGDMLARDAASYSGSTSDGSNKWGKYLRYAPVLGSAIGAIQNAASKPDYSSPNAILEAANQMRNYTPVNYIPISNYLQYRPFDRTFWINKHNAQAGATRRAIMNTSSPSRNAALLAADYNAQIEFGDLVRKAEEYNLKQREAVETFNRATNMANSEMGMKASMANQNASLNANKARLAGIEYAMKMKEDIDAARAASMSANLTNLFDNIGSVGTDALNRVDMNMLIDADAFGTLSQKPWWFTDKQWERYQSRHNNIGSYGGKMNKTKKRRGGLTY